MKRFVLGAVCFVLGAGAVTPAAAEIVFLKSGRTVNVAGHRVEGDMIVLALRSGGEMTMAAALVDRFAPDEVPWVDARKADVSAVAGISCIRPMAPLCERAFGLYADSTLMTAREYGVRDAYDPAQNINAGVKHLRSLLDRFDVRLAVAAYNAGAGAVQRYGGIPPYRETRDYVRKVLAFAGVQ